VKAIDYLQKEYNFMDKWYKLKRFGKYRDGFYYFDYKDMKKKDNPEVSCHVIKNKEEIPIEIPNISKKDFAKFTNKYVLNDKGDKMLAFYLENSTVKAHRFILT
jgi:hypothetical protein